MKRPKRSTKKHVISLLCNKMNIKVNNQRKFYRKRLTAMRSTITISLILLFCPFVTGFICGIRGNGTVNGYFEKPSNDVR